QFVNGVGNDSALVNMNDTDLYGSNPYSTDSYKKQIKSIADIIYNKICKETEIDGVYTFLNTDTFQFQAYNSRLDDGNWSVGYSSEDFESACNNVSTYQNLENASFMQSGYYEIYYDSVYNYPKARIRIHQAPIALLSATISDNKIVIANKSYDPEFCTEPSLADGGIASGIAESVIEYRNLSADNPEWTTDAPESVSEGETWLVRLTVTDADNAASSTVCQLSESATAVAPYGTFKLSSNQYIKGIDENVQIIDSSYSLDGSSDFTVSYVIKNSAGTAIWTSSSTVGNANYFAPDTTFSYKLSNLSVGTYTVTMTAQKGSKKSEAVSRSFSVVQGYKITYDANGGNGAPATQYKIYNQNLTISNIAPTKSGYTFNGWTNGTTVYMPGQIYTGNAGLSLTAVWAKNMIYEAQDYSGEYDGLEHGISITLEEPSEGFEIKYGTTSSSCTLDSLMYKMPGTYTVYFTITKDGYQTVTNSRKIYIDKATPVLDITDKTARYDGTAREIDAAVITNAVDLTEAEIVYTYYLDEECTIPTTPDNSQSAAEGLAPVDKGVYYVKASFAGDDRYYAAVSNVSKLTIEKYTVSFNMNGLGTQLPDITDVVPGTCISEPVIPTSETHIFIGWYKDPSCLITWNFNSDTVEENMTLHAKWKAKSEYDVRYYDEEGNPHYETFDEALESGSDDIVIQNDITISDVVIPEGCVVTVEPDADVTVDGPLTVDGTLINDGDIYNNSEINGNGT
ncbi:MAG: InlB B-repeat-containing protein, partial [Butyrivibrio sp.]